MTAKPRRARKFRVPKGFAGAAGSPYAAVLDIDRLKRIRRTVLAIFAGVLAHAFVFAITVLHSPEVDKPKPREIPVIVAAPPPPPPKPPPDPIKPPQHTEARRPMPRHTSQPPPPAKATKLVAQAPTPDTPVALDSFTMPEGESAVNVGGWTSENGTGTQAITETPVVEKAKPAPPPAPSAPSQAKPPEPESTDWHCPWPEEAQDSDLSDAWVTLQATITANGDPQKVDIKKAPGPAFADSARRCVYNETWRPGLDDDGKRTTATTPVIAVHFYR